MEQCKQCPEEEISTIFHDYGCDGYRHRHNRRLLPRPVRSGWIADSCAARKALPVLRDALLQVPVTV
jgi:hypothetical protein